MYNADQLRATCQQYIAINLAALLEARYVRKHSVEPCLFMVLVILQKGSYLLDIELFWLSENIY